MGGRDDETRGGEVIKGTLDMLISKTLQLGPMHGWGITEMIEQSSPKPAQRQSGLAVSRALPSRPAWPRHIDLAHDREQPHGALLRAVDLRPKTTREERAGWERLSRGVNLVLDLS
jgi:hypothetical protein